MSEDTVHFARQFALVEDGEATELLAVLQVHRYDPSMLGVGDSFFQARGRKPRRSAALWRTAGR